LTSILVLSDQNDIFSEIQKSLGENYNTHLARSHVQLSEILVDGEIEIVILDTTFLKTAPQEEIVETLSFFPELILIATVESGETKSLVDLFQNFEIYRYLQKPYTAGQLKKCIDAAAKKHSKKELDSNLSNNEDTLIESSKNIYIICISIILLLGLSYFLFSSESKESQVVSTNENTPPIEKKEISIEENISTNNTSKLLSLEHEAISLSAQTEAPENSRKDEIDVYIFKAKKAEKNQHYFEPDKENALHYYLRALNIDPDNATVKNALNKLTQVISNKLNLMLSENKFEEAVVFVDSIKKSHPEYKQITTLESSLLKKGNELLSKVNSLSINEEYEPALKQLDVAKLLLSGMEKDLISVKNDIEMKFVSSLIKQTENALKNKDFKQAKIHIEKAKTFDLQKEYIASLEQKLDSIKRQIENDKLKQERTIRVQQLSNLANAAIEDNNLIYPENSNAMYYLQTASKIEPDNKKIKSQIQILVSLLLIQIETDISENTLASASSKIKKVKELGIKKEEVSLLETKLMNAINER